MSKFFALFRAPKIQALPPLPAISEPAVAPDPDDLAIKAQQRRKAARKRQRSGRLSTINTDLPLSGITLG